MLAQDAGLLSIREVTVQLMHHSWLWGVIVCICATAVTALGLVIQKLSHTLNEQGKRSVVYYRQPLWIAGFCLFMVAQVVNLAPMAGTPQVMLSSLGATALVFNAIFAYFILQEEMRPIEVGVMLGMICGVVMVVATTPVEEVEKSANPSLHEIMGPLTSPYFLGVTTLLLVGLVTLHLTIMFSSLPASWPDCIPLSWTLCSAVSSGFTVNLFKAVAELVVGWQTTLPHLHWECYAVTLAALLFGISQIHCMNRALNLGRAMVVVPWYFALALLAQLLLAEVVEVCIPDTTLKLCIFVCGIAMILVFIVVLARAKIAYEEEPDAELELVIEKSLSVSWAPTLKKGFSRQPTPSVPSTTSSLMVPRSNLRAMDPELSESVALIGATKSMSMWDRDNYQDSFDGKQRTYSVAVIGLGVA